MGITTSEEQQKMMYATIERLDKNAAIKQYAPLVRKLAHHLLAKLPANVEIDDIIQAGLIGLMDAVSRYEETAGAQFETYATQRIKGAMLDELRAADWLPRSIRKNQRTPARLCRFCVRCNMPRFLQRSAFQSSRAWPFLLLLFLLLLCVYL